MSRRVLIPAGLAAIVAAFAFIIPLASAQAATSLLSQGKPATASSVEGANTPASAAVDGDTTVSRWSSQFSDPQWLQVDLGDTATISQVVLYWEAAYATGFQIQTSADGSTWTPVYSTTTGTGGTQTLNVTGTGRYVRMYGTTRVGGYGYSLFEFQVYGSMGSTTPPPTCGTADAAQGKTATASSTENGGTPASAAVDGSATTRWSSAASDPQWLQVDLGSTQPICGVTLQWENAYGKSFQIQASDDQANWTNLYSTTTGTGGTETHDVSGSGRYVRMYGTARGTGYGYSLWEFQIRVGGSATTTSPTPSPTPSDNTSWTKVWGDDFTGAAGTSPSSANWLFDTGTSAPGGPANWGTGEVETMTNSTANVSTDGSHLNITALNNNGAWTSGRIESQRSDFAAPAGGKLQISASIKQPNVASPLGYWPAFWTLGAGSRTGGTWPAVGETDIMENVNGLSESAGTLHCGVAPAGPCNEFSGLGTGLAQVDGANTAYHTYSEVIDRSVSDESLTWSVDGKQIGSVKESQVGVSTWKAAIDHGFFIIFDLAMGGSFPNAACGCTSPSAATTSGGTLSVDSVTVSTATGATPPQLTTPGVPGGSSVVKVTGSQGNWSLQVNGQPYTVKGVTYGPATTAAEGYMNDLATMGVNTVRTWGTDATTQPLLDQAAAHGIKVINGFWLNQGADYVNDTAYKTSTLDSIKQWVTTYKNHPGVLMWDVGNEVLLTTQDHYTGAAIEQQRNAYAQYVDQIAQAIHAIDPNHPVTSTDAWVGAWPYYKANTPHLDLYAVNSYGAVCGIKQAWISGNYTVPYILTEGGPAGEWEVPNDANGVPTEPTDQQKRDGYTNSWNCLMSHTGVALGGTEFNYGLESDFGGVWLNLRTGWQKRLGYYAVKQMYGGGASANTPPVISSITVPGTGVPAGGQFTLNFGVSDPNNDNLRYSVLFNSKPIDGSTAMSYQPFTQTGNGTLSVTAPARIGTWKVYLYVYDGQGNVGIEQKTIKVVPPVVAGTNIALGKTVTASSYQAVGDGAPFPPSNVVDNNLTTRWASDWTDPQWIQVDLGSTQSFNHVQLVWESAYAKAYQIQTSNDGTNWTTIYSTTTGDGAVDDLAITGSGRYVRMYGTARATTFGYSMFEFGIYH
jgi:hypothetical protein